MTYRSGRRTWIAAGAAAVALAAAFPAHGAEGFGATTPGGAGQRVVRVTTLADSGSGSLRTALGSGYRTIVFDVAGTIKLATDLSVRGPFVTIDGLSAPGAGITLKGRGLSIYGSKGAHDVIVRGIRIRDAEGDGIKVRSGAYNVLIERVSVSGSGDGNVDITRGAHDVTIAWSILARPRWQKNMLIKYDPSRITLHHNLFVGAQQRNPQVRIDDEATTATDTTLDMRNNVVSGWSGGYGTLAWYGTRVNIVDNFYDSSGSDTKDALIVCAPVLVDDAHIGECGGDDVVAETAEAFVEGNVSGAAMTFDINAGGTVSSPFPASGLTTTDACNAAHGVLAGAGRRPLDSVDAASVATVRIDCP